MKRGIIFLALALLLVSNASAVSIGVNKAVLNFEDVLNGGYAEDTIIISTDASRNVSIEKEVSGDIEEWVRFEPEETVLNRQKPGRLTIIIEPPIDIATGNYQGEIRLITSPIDEIRSGQFGSAIRTSFRIKVQLSVTNDEIVSCTVGGFNLKDTEITYPVEFSATATNNGNVRVRPNFQIEIFNQQQTETAERAEYIVGRDILPTTTQEIFNSFENWNLDTGQYWAKINSELCSGERTITFNVVEKGEIADKGELMSINNPLWVKVGDIVPIETVFRNTGTRYESAQLKGTVKLQDQIVKVIDTDPIDIAPGETITLETFFNPKMVGQYHIDARVLYNNKLTFWKKSVLNAQTSEEYEQRVRTLAWKSWSKVILVLIVIAILVLLIQIKKKKSKIQRNP